MRISDWSSDVCSSDLDEGVRILSEPTPEAPAEEEPDREAPTGADVDSAEAQEAESPVSEQVEPTAPEVHDDESGPGDAPEETTAEEDRKSVVRGKCG